MISVILVAAGRGIRMKSDVPKQFIEIHGKSILEHTLSAFVAAIPNAHYCIVLHEDFNAKGAELVAKYPSSNIDIVIGGKERFHSVQNALQSIPKDTTRVMIHDAVRPFCSEQLVNDCIDACEEYGNAIPAVTPKDSLRSIQDDGASRHEDRSNFRLVQTPQCFDYHKIKAAYLKPYSDIFTDDASVFEADGHRICIVDGDSKNIKLTTPEDLLWAEIHLGPDA